MLANGEVEALFFVASFRSELIKKLLNTPGVDLFDFKRAEAYTRHFPFLSRLTLPQGALDFAGNLPSRDVQLLAAATQLVVRKNFHPALLDLFLMAARRIHGDGGLFEARGEFPAPKYLDFKLSEEADRYYQSGPSFLRRYLPFWVATFLIRMKILLLPLLALFFPLVRLLPPFYRWRVRARIFRWYDQLQEVEDQVQRCEDGVRAEHLLARLDWIESQVSHITIPRGFSQELYNMRLHIDMLRKKLLDASADCSAPEPGPSAAKPAPSG
jgi:hypothetical protein